MKTTAEVTNNGLKALVELAKDQPDVPAPDSTQAAPAVPIAPAARKSRFSFKTVALSFLGLGVAVGGYLWWDYSKGWESTDDATIAGNTHQIAARISGTVAQVLVDDNEYVHAGQVLVKLDDADEQADLNKANAALEQSKAMKVQAAAQVENARATQQDVQTQAATAQAQLDQNRAQLVKAQADFQRAKVLVVQHALSVAEYDAARAAQDSAEAAVRSGQAGVESAKARIESAAAQLGAYQAALAVTDAQIQSAEAAVKSAQLQLGYTVITASTDGRIGRKSVQTGNRVVLGQPLMAVVEPATWVVANFKETQLARMQPGQEVEVEVDALHGRKLTGHVESFSPASGATFALLPPDNATGNYTKIVQRVPVKIVFDEQEVRGLEDRLAPGLSVVASVNLRKTPVPTKAGDEKTVASR